MAPRYPCFGWFGSSDSVSIRAASAIVDRTGLVLSGDFIKDPNAAVRVRMALGKRKAYPEASVASGVIPRWRGVQIHVPIAL
jgi:hypothetical protein